MSTILDIRHTGANFNDYTGTILDGGSIAINSSGALFGPYGMSITVNGDNHRKLAYKTFAAPNTNTVFSARKYFNPNTLSIPHLGQISLTFFVNSTGTETFAVIKIINISGTNYLRGVLVEDDGTHRETVAFPISSGTYNVEFRVTKASGVSANDATFETWIDGVAKTTLTGVDCYNRFNLQTVSYGVNGISGTITGECKMDEFIVNDDGSFIGDHVPLRVYSLAAVGVGD